MGKILKFTLSLLFVLLISCKATKTARKVKTNHKLSTKQLVKGNASQAAKFKTLQSKLKITLTEQDKSKSYTVSCRLEKDKALWLNAPFSVIRLLITPEKVSFYNKLDRTYFDGDYKYLSDLLGTELDFNKVQNLLLGETIYTLNSNDYKASLNEALYVVQPKNQRDLFEIFFILSPINLKVKSQQISQPKEFKHLQIDYLNYQTIESQIIPAHIKVLAVEANKEINVELEMRNVTLNENFKLPFKIPNGFKAVKL